MLPHQQQTKINSRVKCRTEISEFVHGVYRLMNDSLKTVNRLSENQDCSCVHHRDIIIGNLFLTMHLLVVPRALHVIELMPVKLRCMWIKQNVHVSCATLHAYLPCPGHYKEEQWTTKLISKCQDKDSRQSMH